jgi:hypothetical protein
MNRFLWRLFGIEEDEIPDVSRRGFLKMLGGAAIVGAAAPKYFLATECGWNPSVIIKPVLSYADVSAATLDYIVPALTDNVFKTSPLLAYIRNQKPLKFSGCNMPIQFERLGL